MKIKHKETGKVVEVMEGTKYAKTAYDLVDDEADKKAADAKAKQEAKLAEEAQKKAEAEEKAKAEADKKAADAKANK